MQTLKFLLGMMLGTTIGYSAMALKDKKVSFNVTVADYDDDFEDYEECDLDCECGDCCCGDDCEPIDFDLVYEDDYMTEGEVFDEYGEPIIEDDEDIIF